MIIERKQPEFPELSRTVVVVHDSTEVILKYVELCRHESPGSWSWLDDIVIEDGRMTLKFGNYNAAAVIYRELKRAAKMTVEQAQKASDAHCKAMKLWSTIALLLVEQREREEHLPEDFVKDWAARVASGKDAAWGKEIGDAS